MSCLIKSKIPYFSKEIIIKTLISLGINFEEKNDEIFIHDLSKYEITKFIKSEDYYILQYDKYCKKSNKFLKDFTENYKQVLEKEKKNLEEIEKRKQYINYKKNEIINKAKEKGYSVQEEILEGKIKLVLIKN